MLRKPRFLLLRERRNFGLVPLGKHVRFEVSFMGNARKRFFVQLDRTTRGIRGEWKRGRKTTATNTFDKEYSLTFDGQR